MGLVVTELPYLIGPEKVVEKVKDAINAKKLVGISDLVDLTDRKHGLRLVVEIKNGFNPAAVMAQLYRYTPMEDSFGINNVCLVDGQPQTLGLVELLKVFLTHRIDVVRRRTAFRLGKKQDRLHLVEGLLIAIVEIDEVIAIIRTSDEVASARQRLMDIYDLTEVQADYILALRLRQLTRFSLVELESERDELHREIAELLAILESREILHQLVSDELGEVAAKYATPRRTVLLESEAMAPSVAKALAAAGPAGNGKLAPLALEIADDPCWVVLSATGQIARTSTADTFTDNGARSKHDVFASMVRTSARSEVGALTSLGRMVRLQVVDMPALPPTNALPNLAGGVAAKEFITLTKGETLIGFVPLNEVFAVGTAAGVVKRIMPEYPLNRDEWDFIALKPKDRVVGAAVAPDDADLVFISAQAQLLRYSAANVRPQGRSAGGMAGMKLSAGDYVIRFAVVSPSDEDAVVVTVAGGQEALPGTPSGSAKVTALAEYPTKGRATGGVRAHRFVKGEDRLTLAWAGHGPAKASTASGVARALPVEHGHRDGSGVALSAVIDLLGPNLTAPNTPVPSSTPNSATAASSTEPTPPELSAPSAHPAPVPDALQEAFDLPTD